MPYSLPRRAPRHPSVPAVLLAVALLLVAVPAAADRPLDRTDDPTPAGAIHPDVLQMLSGPAFLSTPEGQATVELPFDSEHSIYFDEPEVQSITAAFTGPRFSNRVTNDTNQDVEPAIQSLTLSSGTVRTTATYIKYVNVGGTNYFRNHFSSTTNFSTWSSGQLPIPTGYVQTADPLMDSNVYSSGVAPYRMYTVGIVYQSLSFNVPNAIGLWRSDNGGASWTSPTLVANNTNNRYFLDKPDVAVSWAPTTRGQVYVAYVMLDKFNANNTNLYVARSTNGGVSFNAPVLVTTGQVQAPQIVVNSSTGAVYLLWMDFTLNALRFSSSTASATTWSTPVTAVSGNMLPPGTYLTNNVRAVTIPMARWNWVLGKVVVVWHEYESASSTATDIYYTSYTPGGSWAAKKKVNANSLHDQFMPSIDFDSTGNMLVMFYDRYRDILNLYYEESWSYINSSGTILNSGNIGLWSNPNKYGNKFIGDYQDNWYWLFTDTWGNRFNGVWVYQPNTGNGDIYVTGVN